MPPSNRRPLTPEERERRLRWLQDSYVATAVFFPKEGTAEYNRDQIKTIEDLRRFPPAQAVDRLDLSDFDAYISAEEDAPHGDLGEVELPNGQTSRSMVRRPNKDGFILANWKDETTGDYMCSWLIHGNDAGLKQVLDIGTQRKPQTSFAWRTEFAKDPKTGKTRMRVVPDHIAVLGHEGHEPEYPECNIVRIEPLSKSNNRTLPRLRELMHETRTQQVESDIEQMMDSLRSYADRYLEEESAKSASHAEFVRDTIAALEFVDAQNVSVPPIMTTSEAPLFKTIHTPPPVAHFSLPVAEPSVSTSPVSPVCAASSTNFSNMEAPAPNNNAPAPSPAPTTEQKKPLTTEELQAKYDGLKNRFQSGELKVPRFLENGQTEGDDMSKTLYTAMLNLESQLARREADDSKAKYADLIKQHETATKNNEQLNRQLEQHKILGQTRTKFDSFNELNQLHSDPAWKNAVHDAMFDGLSQVPVEAREKIQAGLDQWITVCSAWKRARDTSPSDVPAAKQQRTSTYVDPDIAASLQDSINRNFSGSSNYGSGSSSSSSSSSAPAYQSPAPTTTFKPTFDIDDLSLINIVQYNNDDILAARAQMNKHY